MSTSAPKHEQDSTYTPFLQTDHLQPPTSFYKMDTDEIDPHGDVVLVLGQDDIIRLRVFSSILTRASKPFAAMFDGRFAEGESLSGSSPKKIKLVDDNPEAMRLLCNILHMQNDKLPHTLSSEQLIDIALLVDKYDCSRAVKLASSVWLQRAEAQLTTGTLEERLSAVAAAYLLDEPVAFRRITSSIVLNEADSLARLKDRELMSSIPVHTLRK